MSATNFQTNTETAKLTSLKFPVENIRGDILFLKKIWDVIIERIKLLTPNIIFNMH